MHSLRPPYRFLRLLALVPAATLLALAALQAQQTGNSTAPDAPTLAKYDKNQNGKLDPDELYAIQADEAKAAKAVASTPVTAAASEEVVELSPFEVKADNNKGYSASNTLAGTRLNSALEDLAGSVSVVTKQQLLDTAAIDINDIFLYEVGTEGTGQFTDMTTDGRGDYDNVAGNPTGSNRVRGLSAANIAIDGFSSSSSIPIDTYNISAVEIARGANSSLAGVGEAGGTVNLVQNRANLNRSTTSVTARIDSYEGFRGSLDVNRPIVKNLLSMRFSAVYEEKGYVRKPSMDRVDRQNIGFSYKPFRRTNISGSYEWFNEWARRANSVTPRDTITPWKLAGSPTWDWTTRTFTVNGVQLAPVTNVNAAVGANRPAGIVTLGSSGVRNLQYIDDGKINFIMAGNNGNLQQFTKSADISVQAGLYKIPGSTDKSIYDYTEINLAAPNYEIQKTGAATARLEQGLLDTRRVRMTAELGWRKEDQVIYQRSFIAQLDGVGSSLSVDTNKYLNDGRPNPFFQRPFIGGVNPQVFRKLNYSESFRAQVATDINLADEQNMFKWLGRHRTNVYGEYNRTVRAPSLRFHDTIGAHPYFNPATTSTGAPRALGANNGSLFYPLYYFGKTAGGGVEYGNTGPVNPTGSAVASYPTVATSATVLTSPYVTDTPIDITEAFFSAQTVQKKLNRTVGATIQSFFLHDAIVTTFGKRKDRAYTIDTLGTAPFGADGYTDYRSTLNFGTNKRWREGDTDTKGVVVRPFRDLPFVRRAAESGSSTRYIAQVFQGAGLHYNESQNFKPEDTAYNVFLEELPNPSGKSKEYGLNFILFDRKLNIRITKQETLQTNSRAQSGVIGTRLMSIDLDVPSQTRNFDLLSSLRTWYLGTTGTTALLGVHPEWTEDQFRTKASQVMKIDRATLDDLMAINKTITDASDAKSTGTEVEIQFNPTRNWTMRATGGTQKAIESKISGNMQRYIDIRLPIWESIVVPTELRPDGTQLPQAGASWWTTATTGSVPRDSYFLPTVKQPLDIAIANQGKAKTQSREYTANFITRYQLAGLFSENKYLKNMSVGGSYRWASRAILGYLGGVPDSDGVVRKLDPDKPVWDKATGNIDLLLTYSTRLFNGKIRTNFQLNVRNLTESGHLQGAGINPDGAIWQYRIIDPRQFIFQTTFEL